MADNEHLYTCLSCSIAFAAAEDQREHYRSDHHRYNMKRRVAGLPPVSVAIFNQKVLERRQETAIMSSLQGSTCEVCNKTYSTENAYRSHLNSKKHRETELKATSKPKPRSASPSPEEPTPVTEPTPQPAPTDVETKTPEADEDDTMQTIDQKIAAARSKLSTSQCLFCTHSSQSLQDNMTHMAAAHSFFIPDTDYLTDLAGLIAYLGEKVAVGNVCLYCNERGRDFRTLDAVRKHMVDKGHCKLSYNTEKDKLELSDYYDFTSSYASTLPRRRKSKPKVPAVDEEWEDVQDGEAGSDVDEVVEEIADEDDQDSDLDDNTLAYGDSHFELVLPSGARIGHRSLRRYYNQHFSPTSKAAKEENPNSGAALVRKLLKDKNSDLVPLKGGFGAYGSGTQVIKARNRGEAREAGRHVKEFRDQKRREEFKTRIGFRGNYQEHYRDPLLQ